MPFMPNADQTDLEIPSSYENQVQENHHRYRVGDGKERARFVQFSDHD